MAVPRAVAGAGSSTLSDHQSAAPTDTGRPRIVWLDRAKGAGILFVVVGHALGGLVDSPLKDGVPAYRMAFAAIYTFHMPLFFLLSGILVGERIKRDRRGFLTGLAATLVWPYFLWSTVQFTIIYALGNVVNQPVSAYWPTLLALPWRPVSQFWFLSTLFVLHAAAGTMLRRLEPVGFLLIGLAAKSFALVVPLPIFFRFPCLEAPYYALGLYLGLAGVEAAVVARARLVRLLLLPAVAALVIAATVRAMPGFDPAIRFATTTAAGLANIAWNPLAFAAALAGSFAAIGLASALPDRIGALLGTIGRRTMTIFVLHILVIAGVRIFAIRVLHIGMPAPILALTVVAGVAIPLAADEVLRRLGMRKPLGLGG